MKNNKDNSIDKILNDINNNGYCNFCENCYFSNFHYTVPCTFKREIGSKDYNLIRLMVQTMKEYK